MYGILYNAKYDLGKKYKLKNNKSWSRNLKQNSNMKLFLSTLTRAKF